MQYIDVGCHPDYSRDVLVTKPTRTTIVLEAYRKHVAERAELGTVPLPLNEKQVAELVELLKNPPAGEDAFLMDLLENRIPAGVDQAAYVKAAFLAAIVKGEATSPLISKKKAVEILGTMQGGYNVQPVSYTHLRAHET